ncbi:MAG: phosphoribosyltransferase family protein, partial [Parcubacteria group bacterium]
MIFSSILKHFVDFLFPKNSKLLQLEMLPASELLHLLPPAEDTGDENVLALFNYKDALVRELVWEIKYKGNRNMAKKVAHILYDVILTELSERALTENFIDPLLIPVPLSDKRKHKRGYNQAEILTEEIKNIDKENRLKVLKGQLVKHKDTVSQTTTATRGERLANLKGTMHINHEANVRGRSIILIDDVTTTGATFKEARRALKEAGAKKIL